MIKLSLCTCFISAQYENICCPALRFTVCARVCVSSELAFMEGNVA